MKLPFLSLVVLGVCLSGCDKPKPSLPASGPSAPATPSPVVASEPAPPPAPPSPGGNAVAPVANVSEPGLAEINRALSAYLMGQLKAPEKLDDLVKAGLIKRLPTPPPGRRYMLNANKTEVVLAN